jgi:hypothetical protein
LCWLKTPETQDTLLQKPFKIRKAGSLLQNNRHISGTRIGEEDHALLPVVGLLNEYALQIMSISIPNKKGGVSLPQITDTSVEQG